MLSYNQLQFLPQAINSVLLQEGVELELLVIDPGSTDGSRDFLWEIARTDDRIRLIFEKDLGPADGLRKGLSLAKNEIVGCLNSDDYYLENALARVLSQFAINQKASVIHAHGYVLEGTKKRLQASDKFTRWRFIAGCDLVLHQSTFYRMSHLRESAVSFNPENQSCWDAEILLDVKLKGGQILRVNDIWGVFRIHSTSITGSGRLRDVYLKEREELIRRAMGRPLAKWESLAFRAIGLTFAVYRRGFNLFLERKYVR